MVHASHNYYLKIFLDRGINVFAWNYRGYGRSTGTPNPDILKTDIEHVLKYVRTDLGCSGKIGVYGRSLGGIPTSHISNQVNLAIVDRSFGNFNDMAKLKFRSRAAEWFFKFGSCGW